MDAVNNNQFEVIPNTKSKRKLTTPSANVYLNPALDLLVNDDPMCNTAMEIVPKKRKRTKSCDIATFENTALDLGISKAEVNEFLARELENVKRNARSYDLSTAVDEPIYANLTDLNMPQNSQSLNDVRLLSVPSYSQNAASNPVLNLPPLLNVRAAHDTLHVPQNVQEPISNDMLNVPHCLQDNAVMNVQLNMQSTLPSDNLKKPQILETTFNKESFLNVPPNLQDSIEQGTFCYEDFKKPQMLETNFNKESFLNVQPNLQDTIEQSTFCNENCKKPQMLETTFNKESFLNMQANLQDTTLDLSDIKDDNVVDSGVSDMEHKSLNAFNSEMKDISSISNITNIQTNITNQIFVNNPSNLSLSFIDRLALDSPNASNQSIFFDDDLNESNIMEIKTITIITKKKKIPDKNSTNPFLNPNIANDVVIPTENPFLDVNETKAESEYNAEANILQNHIHSNEIMPRRLFDCDTNSTISTVNESNVENQYENIDGYRSESPIYENSDETLNKQSKILGCDVSQFSAIDIMNLNKICQANTSNESNDSKKDLRHQILKASNKLSKKVFQTLRRKFKGDKPDPNITLNPYEVPRKPTKGKAIVKDVGFENPALNLDISDDIEIEEIDGVEHTYETIKTLRNTQLNMNITPLKERNYEPETSHNRTNTPGKKVRFDSTLNREKIITGNSFDCDIQSPGFDAKIDKYHDELENCINERKFLQQNM